MSLINVRAFFSALFYILAIGQYDPADFCSPGGTRITRSDLGVLVFRSAIQYKVTTAFEFY